MNRRTYHARSSQALLDVELTNDGTSVSADIFVKILDASLLTRSAGYKTNFLVQFPNAAVNEYIEDLIADPRFNSTSKTFFASYNWPVGGLGAQPFQLMLGYWSADLVGELENTIGLIGLIAAS